MSLGDRLYIDYTVYNTLPTTTRSTPSELDCRYVAVLLLLLIVATFHHMQLGLQVVIEDYVSNDALKIPALLLNTFFCAGVGILSAFAVLQISFGG